MFLLLLTGKGCAHSHQFFPLCNPQSWVMKISMCVEIFRSVTRRSNFFALIVSSRRIVLYRTCMCAIVCRVFIAQVVPSPNSLTVDWEEVTFPNYPSSLVCSGLHHELLCWFFLPALRHTSSWLHRARTRLYGLGGRHTVWRLSTSCSSRLLSVNDSFPFGCVDLLSLSRPRYVTDTDAVMPFKTLDTCLYGCSHVTVYRMSGPTLCWAVTNGIPHRSQSPIRRVPSASKTNLFLCKDLVTEHPSRSCVYVVYQIH